MVSSDFIIVISDQHDRFFTCYHIRFFFFFETFLLLSNHVFFFFCQDDGHISTDESTMGSEDEWETASGDESTDEELPVDIMDLAAADGSHSNDDGADDVDRDTLQEARNRVNEAISTNKPGNIFC